MRGRIARLAVRLLGGALRFLIAAYRVGLSPHLGPSCRYEPSCSAYADEAIRTHGPGRGLTLALRRVARCHPLRAGGFDPVPAAPPGDGRGRRGA